MSHNAHCTPTSQGKLHELSTGKIAHSTRLSWLHLCHSRTSVETLHITRPHFFLLTPYGIVYHCSQFASKNTCPKLFFLPEGCSQCYAKMCEFNRPTNAQYLSSTRRHQKQFPYVELDCNKPERNHMKAPGYRPFHRLALALHGMQ